MICLAGLGNPGPEYARNRHNAGRLFIEFLAHHWKAVGGGKKADCDLSRVNRHAESLVLAIPRTYMNENGPPLANLIGTLGISPDQFLVFHDDLDLPFGRLQLKKGGSSAGHRGVESLYRSLGSPEFYRLRIGIGRPVDDPAGAGRSTRDYVLSDFNSTDFQGLDALFTKSVDGIDHWIKGDPSRSAKFLNTSPTE